MAIRTYFFGWDGSVEIYVSDDDPVLYLRDKRTDVVAALTPTAEDLDQLEACIKTLRGRRLPERETD